MARQDVNFGFTSTGADGLAKDFRKVGDNATLAAKGARLCADELRAEERAGKAAADGLRKAERAANLLDIAEHELDREIEKTNRKLLEQAAAADVGARRMAALDRAADRAGTSFKKLGDKGPGWLAPLLAAVPALATIGGVGVGAGVGLAGAFTAGAGALAAFGAVAKPVLADAKKAAAGAEAAQTAHAAAVAKVTGQYAYAMSVAKTKAQRDAAYAAEQKGFSAAGLTQTAALSKAYAGLSPAQVALSRQIGQMSDAWDKVKAAQTPVIAGALQPWLATVTALTGHLSPIIAAVAPVIKEIGTQFSILVGSSAFTTFVKFIAGTGSAVVAAGGNLITGLLDAFITLLPKFNPLIKEAAGWVSGLGDSVAHWANSQKAADAITAFMGWFNTNGPAVGRLLQSVGAALANLVPGLTAGGALEIKALTGLLNFIARLPKGIAGPVAEVAGALLILSKLPGGGKVISIGIKAAPALLKWLTGGVISIGSGATAAGEMAAAFETGGTSAAAKMSAALAGGGAAAGAEGAAGGAAGAAGKAGLGAALGPVALGIAAGIGLGLYLKKYHTLDKPPPANQPGPRLPVPASAATAFKTSPLFAGSYMGQDWAKAAAAVTAATNVITGDFTRQQKAAAAAKGDVDTYTKSIQDNGANSLTTRFARAQLITDMEQAGVKSSVATGDVDAYSAAVLKNGANSDQARGARSRLISDILSASGNAKQGQADLSAYTAAVRDGGAKSDAARGARQRLITDLENSGLSAKDATGLVDGLQSSIDKLHGKAITLTEKGLGKFTIAGPPGMALHPGFATGGLVRLGTGPVADDVPAMLSRGEVVVPARMVSAGAVDHLRGALPGFAGGGAVSSYKGSAGGLGPWTTQADATFTATMTNAMTTAMTAATKQAMQQAFDPFAGITGVPSGAKISGSAAAAMKFAQSILWAYGWGQNQFPPLRNLWMGESGWNYRAYNASSGATGIPQSLPGSKMASAGADWRTNPATQIRWGLGYIKSVYGSPAAAYSRWLGRSPHWYSEGGLIPGYASGGSVAQRGQTWLNAWRSRHGGGYGAAHGPVVLNEQIPEMTAAIGRARVLSKAGGLSAGQHRFWASAAADETRRLAVLKTELTTERAWRSQLAGTDAGLARVIGAAGSLPSLAGNVRGWKAQLAAHQYTIGQISGMLGYSDAYIKAHPAPPVLPKVTHTYGGDVANTIGTVLASALGPFTGARAGGLVMDTGGTLKPGWQPVYNGTGRPETLVPAAGGGKLQIEWVGGHGSDELERWIRKNVRIRGGGDVQKAYGSR